MIRARFCAVNDVMRLCVSRIALSISPEFFATRRVECVEKPQRRFAAGASVAAVMRRDDARVGFEQIESAHVQSAQPVGAQRVIGIDAVRERLPACLEMQLERILFDIGSAGERFLHGGAEARARDRVGIGIETGFGERRAPQRQAQVVVEQRESRARRQQQCEISPAPAAEALCLRVRVIQQQIACGLSRVTGKFWRVLRQVFAIPICRCNGLCIRSRRRMRAGGRAVRRDARRGVSRR